MALIRVKYELALTKCPFYITQTILAIAHRAFFSSFPVYTYAFFYIVVEKGMEDISQLYQWLDEESKLEIHYPDYGHDFPTKVRGKSYEFLDRELDHTPRSHFIE